MEKRSIKNRSIHLSLHILKDPEEMAEEAGQIFSKVCRQAVAERGVFHAALSGGHTPEPFFRLLSHSDWADALPWDKMTFFWVDERAVDPDHPNSNYALAKREFLGLVPATHFYRIKGEENAEEEARRYAGLIRKEFGLEGDELPRFDFMLLGMGADGHTASIFPGSPLLNEKKHKIVADVYIPEKKEERVTLTLPVINNSRCCMFMVNGADKHKALSEVLNLLAVPQLPAQMVRPEDGELIWVVDEAAASGE